VQAEEGHVSPAGVAFCAEQLGLTRAQVAAVATFYTMYKRRPAGEWLVSVCTNTMCGVLGGDRAYEALSERLGVGHDETTPDGTVTLEHAECLAACDYAPVMTVNYEFFDKVSADEALRIVERLRAGERPTPSRGGPLCTFREISLQLAGFQSDAARAAGVDGPATGEHTLAGSRLAEQHGISVPGFDPDTPIRQPAPDAAGSPGHERPATAAKPSIDRSPSGQPPDAQKERS
jgi:NADH-quinone oxidoreductase subunit E